MSNDAMASHETARQQLQERLAALLERVRKIEGDLRSAHDPDWPERATELQNDEVLEGLDEMGRREVRQIREALDRIEHGHYGACASCGAPIGAARLTAVPTATTCLSCAFPQRRS
jgi:RNA polymerase-binding protein DksA